MLGATLWESVKGLLEKEGINQSGNLIPVGHKSGVLVGLHSRAGESLCSLACVSLGDVKLSFRKGGKRSSGRLAETRIERHKPDEGRAPLLHAHFLYASKRDPESGKT